MKILNLGIIAGIFFLFSCSQEQHVEKKDSLYTTFADSLNSRGDMFEITIPKSFFIQKSESHFEMTTYGIYDSSQNFLLTMGAGGHSEVPIGGCSAVNGSVLDSFFVETVWSHGYFDENDSLKREKFFVYDIVLSSECSKENPRKKRSSSGFYIERDNSLFRCSHSHVWFVYDSTKVDERITEKIISSLKYRSRLVP